MLSTCVLEHLFNSCSPTEQEESAARAVCLGSQLRVVTMVAVTQLVWLDSAARTLRVAAVVVVARLAR